MIFKLFRKVAGRKTAQTQTEFQEQSSHRLPEQYDEEAPPPFEEPQIQRRELASPPPDWEDDKCNLVMGFLSDLAVPTIHDIEWEAHLKVYANSIPSLMRNGFYWDKTNIREEESYIVGTDSIPHRFTRAENGHAGMEYARWFFLADRAQDP